MSLLVTADLNGVAIWVAGEKAGVFDSLWDAKAAKTAAESVPAMLAPIFGEHHAHQTAAVLRAKFNGEQP